MWAAYDKTEKSVIIRANDEATLATLYESRDLRHRRTVWERKDTKGPEKRREENQKRREENRKRREENRKKREENRKTT